MEEQSHLFSEIFDDYVDELLTSCRVFGIDGQHVVCQAIWDTGAECSVISQDIINQLGLTVYSKAEMYHAAGQSISNTYHVYIGLKEDMLLGPVQVMEGKFNGYVVLLGMDIIGSGDLLVTNNEGHTEMAFSVPSTLKVSDVFPLKGRAHVASQTNSDL